MHPLLVHFSIFTMMEILKSEESVIQFLEEVGLIPKMDVVVNCPLCRNRAYGVKNKATKIGWRWVCSMKKKNGCSGSINPVKNTFLENTRIPYRDVLAIIFEISSWRARRGEASISTETVIDYYCFCREIAEVYASHNSSKLGGPGKSILIDETFLTKRKYNRGRRSAQNTQVVLGIYCREDKEGLFFLVNGKSKRDLWPRIKKHCHPETEVIYTDSAKQYLRVEQLFNDDTRHEKTNHRAGQFVHPLNPANTINDLENENKHFKKSLINRRSPKALQQYMALHYYRRSRLDNLKSKGEKIQRFLDDIISVYPGYGKDGLALLEIDAPTPASEGIEHLMPPEKRRNIQEEISEDDAITYLDDPEGDPDWDDY